MKLSQNLDVGCSSCSHMRQRMTSVQPFSPTSWVMAYGSHLPAASPRNFLSEITLAACHISLMQASWHLSQYQSRSELDHLVIIMFAFSFACRANHTLEAESEPTLLGTWRWLHGPPEPTFLIYKTAEYCSLVGML